MYVLPNVSECEEHSYICLCVFPYCSVLASRGHRTRRPGIFVSLKLWTTEERGEERKIKRGGGGPSTRIERGLEEEREGVAAAMATAHVGILETCTAECEVRDRVRGWQILYL